MTKVTIPAKEQNFLTLGEEFENLKIRQFENVTI